MIYPGDNDVFRAERYLTKARNPIFVIPAPEPECPPWIPKAFAILTGQALVEMQWDCQEQSLPIKQCLLNILEPLNDGYRIEPGTKLRIIN
jgi:hypothetical protein